MMPRDALIYHPTHKSPGKTTLRRASEIKVNFFCTYLFIILSISRKKKEEKNVKSTSTQLQDGCRDNEGPLAAADGAGMSKGYGEGVIT